MKQIPDEILIKALELHDQGQTPERIFAAFPEVAGELARYFELITELRADAGRIAPPSREVLSGALRRAAAMRDAHSVSVRPLGGTRGRPAAARFFGRVPFAFRVVAPALAVLFIVFFAGLSPVVAPGPVPEQKDQVATTPGSENTEVVRTTALAPSASDSAAPVAPTALMMAAPAATTEGQTVPPPAAKTAPAPDSPDPSVTADKIAQAYIANAESEETAFTDTSAEEQSVQP